jgi:hypothetical protein
MLRGSELAMTDSTLDLPCRKIEITIIPRQKIPKAPNRIRSQ